MWFLVIEILIYLGVVGIILILVHRSGISIQLIDEAVMKEQLEIERVTDTQAQGIPKWGITVLLASVFFIALIVTLFIMALGHSIEWYTKTNV